MSKGLEALKDIKRTYYNFFTKYDREQFDTIEKELKRLEKIDDILNTGGGIWAEGGFVSKNLKALEIIKEKQIDVLYIAMHSSSLKRYNEHVSFTGNNKWCLTQEEFDLLKEVLL